MAILFFSLESVLFQKGLENGNVLSTYVYSTNMTGFLIAYSFCAFPFAGVYPEEQEHKYIRYNVIRGSLKSYVLSKTTVIYISSLSIMISVSYTHLDVYKRQMLWRKYLVLLEKMSAILSIKIKEIVTELCTKIFCIFKVMEEKLIL